jgi:hypothetical protein
LQQQLFFRFSLEITERQYNSVFRYYYYSSTSFFVQPKMLIMNRLLHIWIHFSATKDTRNFVASRNWVGGGGFSVGAIWEEEEEEEESSKQADFQSKSREEC